MSVPKGGGAIRGIGEKFSVNPATGTGSLSVPLVSTPGRSGFGPQLSLTYDSGAGNGAFGFGWSLGLPSITRKTDKGLPRYRDGSESDDFLISGAEDLVPILDDAGHLTPLSRTVHGITYTVHLYRPRIEGLFARIERWTREEDGISHWRTITRDNVTTIFGYDDNSRIADPNDARRVFSYLIQLTFDDTGNATHYTYVPDDARGVDPGAAHEANRDDSQRRNQRYLKTIRYGNFQPYFADWSDEGSDDPLPADWHFRIVLDYGDHDDDAPTPERDTPWPMRPDPFSNYRAGFEVRTSRRCRRVLLFHHFPREATAGAEYLVRSSDLHFSDETSPADPRNPNYTMLESITEVGYRRRNGGYIRRAMPPLELFYSQPEIQSQVLTLTDPDSVTNLPEGVDGARYRWVDLNGEGLSGVLTERNGSWAYKPNLSPLHEVTLPDGRRHTRARLGALERVRSMPAPGDLNRQQLLDLSGDGRLDLATFEDPDPGFFARAGDSGWEPFRAFPGLPRLNWTEPNLRYVDLTGDGLADVLITGDDVHTFHRSLGEGGFGRAELEFVPRDEERGPCVVFADGTETVALTDLTGDGLSDIVRVRAGEVCYWPNLGYGRFGRKVTMDGAPRPADPESFDPRRIRWADIDGSGTTDLVYVGADGVQVYFNQSGNSWAAPHRLAVFPGADNLSSVDVVDLLGNGTSCLVWSSPLPGQSSPPCRYVDLMGSSKPHLLMCLRNNLGAETRLAYAPSTRFYLRDKLDGRAWVTRLPFPVQVVERVETYDWIGRSRFVSRYTYHEGFFDGSEREFRGFGMVEQRDTETHREDTLFPDLVTTDEDNASFVPPMLTRTWFHTGAFVESGSVSRQYTDQYWAEPSLRGTDPASVAAREALLLPDTVVESGLTPDELREAYRALKGSALRTEVYAEDGTARATHPYAVTEQNFTVRRIQAFGPNRHAVFLVHPRESLTYQYEREPDDPRMSHLVTLEVDEFANIRHSVSIAYGRRVGHQEPAPELSAGFRDMLAHDQTRLHIGAAENLYTNPVHRPDEAVVFDVYRGPLPAEAITAELTGIAPAAGRFGFDELVGHWASLWSGPHDIAYEDVSTPDIEGVGVPTALARRIVAHRRTLYRSDDLTGLLPLGALESHALPGEEYVLALTPGLIDRVLAGRATDAVLDEGGYVQLPGSNGWWRSSGRLFYSPGDADPPAQELAAARTHFYQPRRAVDPFGAVHRVLHDDYNLLPVAATDPVGNLTTAANDYRVARPFRSTDPNGNHTEVAFDCLGQVVGTAIRGKAGEGDSLAGFDADLSVAAYADAHAHPFADPMALLGAATSRIIHDRFAYLRTRDLAAPDAPTVYTITRETHGSQFGANQSPRVHHLFVYSDGMGREVQHKAQAERGAVPGAGPDVVPRWVGSGWTVYNNKGKPVRTFEPFFTDTHLFEFGRRAGLSSVTFYDPVERVVAVLHPDDTFEKTVFDAWREQTWDANDTVLIADPRVDDDVGEAFRRLLGSAVGAFTSWYDRRIGGTWGEDADERAANRDAAQKAAAHARTPTVTHFDSLGRKCLAVADNGTENSIAQRYATRTALDTEDKPLAVIDARGRRTMEYCLREPRADGGFRYLAGYDMAGEPLYHNDMDGGERRLLSNVAGHPIRSWDARGQVFQLRYDPLQRLTHRFLSRPDSEDVLLERSVYGDRHPDPTRNLKGQIFRRYDGAGVSSNERYDFKGNPTENSRQFARQRPTPTRTRQTPDWSAIATIPDAPILDVAALDAATAPLLIAADRFTSTSHFDAMNRPIQLVLPHAAGAPPSVVQPTYNEANLLESVRAWIRQPNTPTELLDPATADAPAVTGIEYNAHGQRITIRCGNGSVTSQSFDHQTQRLLALSTTRPHNDPDARVVQALRYTYDPHGNITRLRDDADIHNVVFFRNRRVDPTADYTYDAIYRLIRATGREHLGQTGNAPTPPHQVTHDDGPRTHLAQGVRLLNPGDGNAVDTYTENFKYDPAGNLETMIHRVAGGGWTRHYAYTAPSRITPAETGNRLTATSLPGDVDDGPYSATYDHDPHGNMTRMPHLPVMTWDETDRLQATSRQVVDTGIPETTHYSYEAAGERLRKTTYRQAALGQVPTRKNERIYLGAIEIYREYDPDGTLTLERETLHALIDHRRIVTAETRILDLHRTDQAPVQLFRYQYSTHLGSSTLELDAQAGVLSYEEYFPYGSTAYQAVHSETDVPKRYRYTGQERDEESDLYYYGGRYYPPWLGRWTACDPAGHEDGPNLYMYVHGNPVAISDPTGMWSWRDVAVVAAVVVVGTVVTVATAGVAGPLVAGAVASVGLSGAAATVATGVAVGAVAGAAGGAAGELTRQVGSGEQISGSKIGRAALVGAALGGVTGGIGAYATTAGGAAQVARASTAVRASSVGRAGAAVAAVASAGARAVARVPGVRQAASVAEGAARQGARALGGIQRTAENLGLRAGRALFTQGSRGAHAVERIAAARNLPGGPSSGGVQPVVERKASDPLAGLTPGEIESAVLAPGRADLILQAPAPTGARVNVSGGMMVNEHTVPAASTAKGATGIVATRIRVHTADPTAPEGSNSASGNTVSITQGGGARRMLPDGSWVQTSRATGEQMNLSHIPIHRD
ncbi:SpvB/TcaC N-terminal domain-containing protein [Rhodococcus jostii]|uniref:SpvB/TcaC N-terminal domain-containing protein n=1 Tax=Rhodococcus jostii TaxID=132919 RepID=UPI0002D81452|nr:SpvB/TcaC N-terminal domain-containing protein [Rhodococcus jostii]